MSILFFYNGKYPHGMAMSKRLHLYCKSLLSVGVELAVVVPGEDSKGKKSYFDKVEYFTVNNPFVFTNYLLRQLNSFYAAFVYARYFNAFAKNYDVIFICGLGWFSSIITAIGVHRGGAKVVLEVNENPYSPEGGRLDTIFMRKIRRWLMLNITFKYMDGFIVISQKLKQLVESFKSDRANVLELPILVDDKEICNVNSDSFIRPYLLHTGAVSETKDGMSAVFEAFGKAYKDLGGRLNFYLTENRMHHSLYKKVYSIIDKYGMHNNIFFTGYLPEGELEKLRYNSSLAIVNKPSNWQNDYNFPTKLGEYLLASIPTIVSSNGEMNRYLTDGQTAFIVPGNDSDMIAEKIKYIIQHPDEALEIGKAGRKMALECFNYKNYSECVQNFFLSVLN